MKPTTANLLNQVAVAEGVDPNDLLHIVAGQIERLAAKTRENDGKFQLCFIDWWNHEGGVVVDTFATQDEAIAERDRRNKELGPGTTCEYYVRTPGGFLISIKPDCHWLG
jgi:hypothetical protein